jgi:hypothetical protein
MPENAGKGETPMRFGALGWVVLVLGLGAIGGIVLALHATPMPGPPGPGGGAGPGPLPIVRIASGLSTVDLALLLALIFVYVRTYWETRARFALGLSVFLGALTIQTVFASPLLFSAFGFGPGGLVPFLSVSYVFATFALSLFLYLSLD